MWGGGQGRGRKGKEAPEREERGPREKRTVRKEGVGAVDSWDPPVLVRSHWERKLIECIGYPWSSACYTAIWQLFN